MMKRGIVSFTTIALLILSDALAFEYVDNPDNPIFNGSQPWDDLAVINPTVLYEEGAYKMWFGGRNVGWPLQIGYASSEDGITWEEMSEPVLTVGTGEDFDAQDLKSISVLHDDSEYKMYYTATNSSSMPRVGLATSPDGIVWTKYTHNPILELGQPGSWNESRSHNASVLKIEGLYYMWFNGRNEDMISGIGLAYSVDGISWTEEPLNPVFPENPLLTWETEYPALPNVIEREDGSFLMAYMGFDGFFRQIGIAHSPDGIQWTRYHDNPIITHGQVGTWNEETSTGPSLVIVDPGHYRMWYAGNSIYSVSAAWSFGQGDISFEPRGDINYDYGMDVSDVVLLVNLMLGLQAPSEYQLEMADLNLDGTINIADLQVMVNTILQ